MSAEEPMEESAPQQIHVQRIKRRVAVIRVKGTAPLIVNRFAEKARQQMLDKMQGRQKVREVRDPERDFQAAIHRLPDNRHGFPATGFKAATVNAARYFDKQVTMTLLKQSIFVQGEGPHMLVPIESGEPKMYEEPVRNATGVADLRYRPLYDEWGATLSIVYVPSLLSLDSLVALVDAGGLGGIGEWRPSSKKSATGVFGTYEVDEATEIIGVGERS